MRKIIQIYGMLFLGMFILTSLQAAEWKAEYCSPDQKVCMLYEQNGSLVEVFFQYRGGWQNTQITITLEQKGMPENLKSQTALPYIFLYKGTQPVMVASYTILDTRKKWDTKLYWYWQYGSFEVSGLDKHRYRLPYETGRRFRVIQGYNDLPTHQGEIAYSIDWYMPEGTPIYASRGGIVIAAVDRYNGGGFTAFYKDKDNYIQILHEDGSLAQYHHLRKDGVKVKEGQSVAGGDLIGYSGNTGYSGGPHLHFAVSKPLDGKKRQTIPVGFATEFSEYERLEKGQFYAVPHKGGLKQKSWLDMRDVVFCRKIDAQHQPVGIQETFTPKKKFFIYIPFLAKKNHTIQLQIFQGNQVNPVISTSWTIQKGWWQTYLDIDLSKIQKAEGKWRAEIIIDGNKIGTKNFTVQGE